MFNKEYIENNLSIEILDEARLEKIEKDEFWEIIKRG